MQMCTCVSGLTASALNPLSHFVGLTPALGMWVVRDLDSGLCAGKATFLLRYRPSLAPDFEGSVTGTPGCRVSLRNPCFSAGGRRSFGSSHSG